MQFEVNYKKNTESISKAFGLTRARGREIQKKLFELLDAHSTFGEVAIKLAKELKDKQELFFTLTFLICGLQALREKEIEVEVLMKMFSKKVEEKT